MNKKYDPALSHLLKDYENQFIKDEQVFFSEIAFQRLARFFEDEQEFQKALEVCDQAIRQYPYSIDFTLNKARLLISLGIYSDAMEVLENSRLIAPQEVKVELLIAEVQIKEGRTREALQLLDHLKTGITEDLHLLCEVCQLEAKAYFREEQYERAYYLLISAIEADPENYSAIRQFGLCVEVTRKYGEAIQFYQNILDDNAYHALAWYYLGQALEYQCSYIEALEAYEYAYLIDNEFHKACRECAALHFQLNNFQKARGFYEELFNNFDADADSDLHIMIGRCYLKMGQVQSAVVFLQQAIKLDPLNDEAFFYMGNCYAEQEKWELAEKYLEKAIRIEEERDEYFAALGEVYYYLEDHVAAISCMHKAIRCNEENSRNWILLATFLLDADDKQEALDILETAIDMVAGADIIYCYVACLLVVGRRQEALYRLGDALSEDFEAHTTLFQILPDLEHDSGVQAIIASYAS
jgi:tetratricopeptide (TPR) repeat protein